MKSQAKLNEFLNESDDTYSIVSAFVDRSFEERGSFSHVAGVMQVLLANAIMELPKARREYYRNRLLG